MRTNNKLNCHTMLSPGIDPGHIGGKQALSPLRHPLWVILSGTGVNGLISLVYGDI